MWFQRKELTFIPDSTLLEKHDKDYHCPFVRVVSNHEWEEMNLHQATGDWDEMSPPEPEYKEPSDSDSSASNDYSEDTVPTLLKANTRRRYLSLRRWMYPIWTTRSKTTTLCGA
jgi:hypothetical protein